MIFISKHAFENEMERRMAEIHFRNRLDERLYKLEDTVRELQLKVQMLEDNRKPLEANYDAQPTCESR